MQNALGSKCNDSMHVDFARDVFASQSYVGCVMTGHPAGVHGASYSDDTLQFDWSKFRPDGQWLALPLGAEKKYVGNIQDKYHTDDLLTQA